MSRTKLRASRLAPTIRTTAKAASTTRRPSRSRRACAPWKPVPDDRSALRNASERSTRAPRTAGASPAATAASNVVSAQNITTEPSSATPSRRGSLGGAMAGSRRTSHHASTRPSALPAIENTALSVNSCRTIRARLPPTAARMASSRCRVTPRESRRFVTLAHAIRSTSATATARTDNAGRAGAVMSSTSARACTTTGPPLPKKNSVSRCLGAARAAAVPSASACASVTPGFSRASAVKTVAPVRRRGRSRNHVRQPEAHARVRELERRRRHADNRVRVAIDDERGAEDARTRPVALAPQPVADDDDRRGAFAIVVVGQESAERPAPRRECREPLVRPARRTP